MLSRTLMPCELSVDTDACAFMLYSTPHDSQYSILQGIQGPTLLLKPLKSSGLQALEITCIYKWSIYMVTKALFKPSSEYNKSSQEKSNVSVYRRTQTMHIEDTTGLIATCTVIKWAQNFSQAWTLWSSYGKYRSTCQRVLKVVKAQ